MQNNNDLYNIVLKNADIVKVISAYYKLEKRGKNYTCLCPFHDDKSLGNFYVSPDKQVFKCFSCGASGNVVSFVKEIEHFSNYFDVYKKIAQICGFELPRIDKYEDKYIDKEKDLLLKILKDISFFYEGSLNQTKEAEEARTYLEKRGLSNEIIHKFKIGYALKDGKIIIEYLKKKGYLLKDISKTGIIELNADTFDKNAGRISFPIQDLEGNIVGFSCRAITFDKVERKYVNTSSTKVFNKSNILYNYYEALNEIRKKNSVYIFEGFMDVIAACRAGFNNSIGLMGTALTIEHIKILKKLNVQVNLCLDLDDPGQSAMLGITDMFEKYNISYKLVNNKVDFDYKDSDEIIFNLKEKGLEKFLLDLIDKPTWMLNYFSKKFDLSIYENKIKLLDSFMNIIKKCKERIEYENYLNSLIYLTNFSFEAIDEYYKKRINLNFITDDKSENFISKNHKGKKKERIKNTKFDKIQKMLIRFALSNRKTINDINSFNEEEILFISPVYKKIYEEIQLFYKSYQVENIEENNFINFINQSYEDKNEINTIITSTNEIYQMKIYDEYSEKMIKELIYALNKEKKVSNNSEIRKNLVKNANDENDMFCLNAIISVKKNENRLKKEDFEDEKK